MGGATAQRDPVGRALELVALFCGPEQFGQVRGVAVEDVPEPQRSLLDHCSHMTVAMERAQGGDVALRVVATTGDGDDADRPYAREILLESRSGKVVLYGIVRIDLAALDEATAREVRAARRPLGRILVERGVLRDVHSVQLVEILPKSHWDSIPGLVAGSGHEHPPGLRGSQARPVYGRVAEIELNGRPAVSLLEIVLP
jgi:hypothetical protein